MGLQKQGGGRRDRMEDKDTKRREPFLFCGEAHKEAWGMWPKNSGRSRLCIHIHVQEKG